MFNLFALLIISKQKRSNSFLNQILFFVNTKLLSELALSTQLPESFRVNLQVDACLGSAYSASKDKKRFYITRFGERVSRCTGLKA